MGAYLTTPGKGPAKHALLGSVGGWCVHHRGFPRHPHRGFETITVTRRGWVDHTDSQRGSAIRPETISCWFKPRFGQSIYLWCCFVVFILSYLSMYTSENAAPTNWWFSFLLSLYSHAKHAVLKHVTPIPVSDCVLIHMYI